MTEARRRCFGRGLRPSVDPVVEPRKEADTRQDLSSRSIFRSGPVGSRSLQLAIALAAALTRIGVLVLQARPIRPLAPRRGLAAQ
jgi:hypothetical protein